MIVLLPGFVAGAMPMLSGSDHLAAVSPLSIEHGRHSRTIGIRWWIGHSLKSRKVSDVKLRQHANTITDSGVLTCSGAAIIVGAYWLTVPVS